jgi:hypothetical protein
LGVSSLFQCFLDPLHRDDTFLVPHFHCLRYNRKRKEPCAHRKEASNSCSCKGSLFQEHHKCSLITLKGTFYVNCRVQYSSPLFADA